MLGGSPIKIIEAALSRHSRRGCALTTPWWDSSWKAGSATHLPQRQCFQNLIFRNHNLLILHVLVRASLGNTGTSKDGIANLHKINTAHKGTKPPFNRPQELSQHGLHLQQIFGRFRKQGRTRNPQHYLDMVQYQMELRMWCMEHPSLPKHIPVTSRCMVPKFATPMLTTLCAQSHTRLHVVQHVGRPKSETALITFPPMCMYLDHTGKRILSMCEGTPPVVTLLDF
jgi:hypothetical protein